MFGDTTGFEREMLLKKLSSLSVMVDDIAKLVAPEPLHVAQSIYSMRRNRDKLFGDAVFGEPAWDMLLDLYISECSGKKISVSSACLAANVPMTTALRWVNALTELGILLRSEDPRDARRSFLHLSKEALDNLDRLFKVR